MIEEQGSNGGPNGGSGPPAISRRNWMSPPAAILSNLRPSTISLPGAITVTSVPKRYVVIAGYVTSRNDGQRHWISASRLVDLYRVDRKECYLVDSNKDLVGMCHDGLIELRPRDDGDYDIRRYDPARPTITGQW